MHLKNEWNVNEWVGIIGPYGTLRTGDVEDCDVEDTTLRTCNFEDRRLWGHATLRTKILNMTNFGKIVRNFSKISKKCPKMYISQPCARRAPRNPPKLHKFPNVGSIYPIKYANSPNRNPQNYILSPTLRPKGAQKPSKLHIFPKCWHHISNIF